MLLFCCGQPIRIPIPIPIPTPILLLGTRRRNVTVSSTTNQGTRLCRHNGLPSQFVITRLTTYEPSGQE